MRSAKIQEIRAWLTKALQDLHSAEWLLTSPDRLYSAVGFHCQQAAEKALKAYLTWRDEPFEKTHSLVALVGKCLPYDQSFEELRQPATTLTPYAVTFRYPGDLPELSLEEAGQALTLARQVWDLSCLNCPQRLTRGKMHKVGCSMPDERLPEGLWPFFRNMILLAWTWEEMPTRSSSARWNLAPGRKRAGYS